MTSTGGRWLTISSSSRDNGGYGRPRFALDRVSRDYQRVDAGSVVRVMWREFTGQTHGLPWLVASARHMDLLDEFQRLVIRRAANHYGFERLL